MHNKIDGCIVFYTTLFIYKIGYICKYTQRSYFNEQFRKPVSILNVLTTSYYASYYGINTSG